MAKEGLPFFIPMALLTVILGIGVEGLDDSGDPFFSLYRLLLQESEEKNPQPSKRHSLSGRRQGRSCGGM